MEPTQIRRRIRVVPIGAFLLGVAVFAAGCGGGTKSPTGRGTAGISGPGRGEAQAVAFARCMRNHGVSNFPDPKISSAPGGGVSVSQAISSNVAQAPAFKSAQLACQKLMPGGEGPPASQPDSAANQAGLVKLAACMRSHGVPNMPDPSQNGVFKLPQEINQQSPAFTKAMNECQANGLSIGIQQIGPGPGGGGSGQSGSSGSSSSSNG